MEKPMTDPTQKFREAKDSLRRSVESGDVAEADEDAILEVIAAYNEKNMSVPLPTSGEYAPDTKAKKPNSLLNWIRYLKRTAERMDVPLTEATADDVNGVMTEMRTGEHPAVKERGIKPNTLKNYQGAVRRFYFYHDFGPEREDIALVSGDETHVDERDMLTPEEIERIRNAADHPRDLAIFDLLLYTGQRNTAIRSLRIRDVDVQEGVYYLNCDAEGLKGADRNGKKRPLLGAVGSVREWLCYHPDPDNPDAYLITGKPRYSDVDPETMVSRNTINYTLKGNGTGEGLKQKEGYHVVTVKSTVVPKTTEDEIIPILEDVSGRKAGEDFGVCMNPEFLREGTALPDFMEPDRIVIGELDKKSGDSLEKIYSEWDAPILRTSLKAAELIKYASNSLLATKISFINEIGNLCKELGIDVYEVADGVGLDHRIERSFLDSGPGFGGSCFPKDVRAVASFMEEKNVEPRILNDTIEVNQDQKTKLVEILQKKFDSMEGKTVAVLGLSFKPGTDDIRQSPAINIISELKEIRANVRGYDPEAIKNMKERHPDIEYKDSYQEAMEDADAAVLVTDWPEFNKISREDIKSMRQPLLLEGRRMEYDLPEENREGVTWP